MTDSHGVASTEQHLWVMDRHANVAEITDLRSGKWMNTVDRRRRQRRPGARPGGSFFGR